MPHRTVITHNDLSEQDQVNLMMRALMQKIKQEIIAETQATNQKTV
jgi:ethanolamine utilization protein EutP (predicted NTPase)